MEQRGARSVGRAAGLGLCAVSTIAVCVVHWTASYRYRIDLHVYLEAVRHWPARSAYDYANPIIGENGVGLGFTYPPVAAAVLWPLAQLRFALADHVWLISSTVCSTGFLALAAWHLPRRPKVGWYPWVVVAVGLWAVPMELTFRLGQINAFLALAVLGDVVAARRGSRFAGIATGLATAIKLTPGVALIYFALARSRVALRNAIASLTLSTAIAFLLSPRESVRYWTSELFDTSRVGKLSSVKSNSLRRLLEPLPLEHHLITALWLIGCAALLVIAVRRASRAIALGNHLAAITIVMCLGAACSPISWSHHLYFLVLAPLLVFGDGRDRIRVACTLATLPLLFELSDPGQNPPTTALRAALLVIAICALPLDQARASQRTQESRPLT